MSVPQSKEKKPRTKLPFGGPLKRPKKEKQPKKKGMTPYEEAIYELLKNARGHLDAAEDLNDGFQDDLEDFTEELKGIDQKRAGKNPG